MVALLTLVSCSSDNHNEKELLDSIEKLWVMSDSSVENAVRESAFLGKEIHNSSEEVNMKYDLLNIRLRDKMYVIPTSDDSIKKVVNYFDEHGTISDRARAYYYLSCVYRDLHDSPKAITSGIKSLDLAKLDDKKDSLLIMHIYSNLTMLFHNQLNMDETIHMALEYLNMCPNDPWAMMDVASAYNDSKDTKNAKKYYDNAYNRMMKDSMMILHPSNYCELLGIFSMYKDEQKSKALYNRLCNMKETERPSNYDYALGLYHKEHNNVDSALYYFEHLYVNSQNWVSKCDAASQIMECYYKRGNYEKATDYALKFRVANDSVIAERQFDLTRNAQAEYKYNRNREEETKMKLDVLTMHRWLLTLIILFMITIICGYTYYIKRRNRLEKQIIKNNSRISSLRKEIEEKEKSIHQAKTELEKTDELLCTKRTELTEIITAMTEKQKELITMKEELGHRELSIMELSTHIVEADNMINKLQYELSGKSKMNKELIKELVSKELTELNMDIIEIFDKSANHRVRLTESQWNNILNNIDSQHPELKTLLEERVPRLNVALLRTAYLMMSGLTNQQIESIMGVSRQTQWERAKKLEKYIGDILPYRKN